jgi:uncharacterized protein YceH (UPF0502 family)
MAPMPDEKPTEVEPAASAPPNWPALTINERRVLGVLVEKAKTTPDVYPLSVNAVLTASNQKSNRDPILNLEDLDVEDALASAQQKGLAIKITGGRVIRWRHALYEAFKVDKQELAILGELLLRGPQTEGELRGRASRMEPIDDLDSLRAILRPMADRGLVVFLTPQGRRGTALTHGFHDPQELERLRTRHASGAEAIETSSTRVYDSDRTAPAIRSDLEERLAQTQAEVAALRTQVADLQAKVAELSQQWQDQRGAVTGG